MIQSIRRLAAVDPGFDPESLLTVHISVPNAATPRPPGAPRVSSSLAASCSIASARCLVSSPWRSATTCRSMATSAPTRMPPKGRAPSPPRIGRAPTCIACRPGSSTTLGIPFVSGRSFLDSEISATPSAVIVSERRGFTVLARTGSHREAREVRCSTRMIRGCRSSASWRREVPACHGRSRSRSRHLSAVRRSQRADRSRDSHDCAALVGDCTGSRGHTRRERVDRRSTMWRLMDERVRRQSALSRFITWVMGVFAGIALWLCAIGIYGVMSYVVTQRTREIGIRLALGAQPREVLAAIVGGGARLIVVGIVLGGLAAVALRRVVSTQLFDVSLTDPAAAFAVLAVRTRRARGLRHSRAARDTARSGSRPPSGMSRASPVFAGVTSRRGPDIVPRRVGTHPYRSQKPDRQS